MNNQAHWHTMDTQQVLEAVDASPQGLTAGEAQARLARDGENKLAEQKPRSWVSIFFAQFADIMVIVLFVAALISGLLGEWVDAAIIGVVILLNAILGTVQESRAEAALQALKSMSAPFARALRDGAVAHIPASELVAGDVVLIEAGDNIPADIRLLECASLKVEESALTGESVPVEKNCAPLEDAKAALGDRINMLYMSTIATYGRGVGVVVATGMHSQIGRIAGQLQQEKSEETPLQKKLKQITNILSIAVLVIAAVIFGVGLLGGRDVLDMFLTAVSLAVAAIPEGLVAVVTIVLAMGMQRMAKRGAIIRKLPAVETLGSTSVICSDKTGTLTRNRMRVVETWTGGAPGEAPQGSAALAPLYEAMGHCNDVRLGEADETIGDPTETALIDYLFEAKIWGAQDVLARSRTGEIPFDSERKRMSVVIAKDGRQRVLVKGAPDVLIARCDQLLDQGKPVPMDDAARSRANEAVDNMARRALRVLAFAYKDVQDVDTSDIDGTESSLTLVGLTGMIDPPRDEARDAIAICRRAGIQPVMITGDHKVAAVAIAQNLGILNDGMRAITGAELDQISDEALTEQVPEIGVYARVAPEHKSRIVRAWQQRGDIVAMTGDGVNDAPALKEADIGVGMGITGTDVSKGASDMVLTDDNFATIVKSVKEGRRIFDNIHKAVRFLLSSNAGEVIALFVATLLGWPLLAPVHILWVNLVTDTFPALALGVEPAEPGLMDRPPREASRPFFTGYTWTQVGILGALEGGLTLVAYAIGQAMGGAVCGTTMAFVTLGLTQLVAALGFFSEHDSIVTLKPRRHKMLLLALAGSALLQLVVVLLPPLRSIFSLTMLSGVQWLIVLGLMAAMLVFIELQKRVTRLLHQAE
nr:cation-translocating P-type ATPase [Maliibacterium massiliense]